MKRFTLLAVTAFLAVVSGFAQTDSFPLQFSDVEGNIIADGAELTFTELEETEVGTLQVPTHLYVKNVSSTDVQGGATYTIQRMTNGSFQTCFPENCVQRHATGTYVSENGALQPGDLKDMQTEWLPEEQGEAVVTYQLLTYKQNVITKKWNVDKYGPQITLTFSYSTTGIDRPAAQVATTATTYSLSGVQQRGRQKGLSLVRLSDGTVRKVIK